MKTIDLSGLQKLKEELIKKESGPGGIPPDVPFKDLTPAQQMSIMRHRERLKQNKNKHKNNSHD